MQPDTSRWTGKCKEQQRCLPSSAVSVSRSQLPVARLLSFVKFCQPLPFFVLFPYSWTRQPSLLIRAINSICPTFSRVSDVSL